MLDIIMWLLATVLCAALYRMGGYGKPFKSWMRDWIIPLVICGYMLTISLPNSLLCWLMFIPVIALMGAALSTYWDFLFSYDNFWFHGFVIGLSMIPFIFCGSLTWYAVVARSLVLAVSMGLLCELTDNVWLEECGRGALIAVTIPLLFI